MSERLYSGLLGIIALLLVISGPFSCSVSSLTCRLVLVGAFLAVLISLILADYWGNESTAFTILFLASLLFLLWRSSFMMPHYVEKALNSEGFMRAQQYEEEGYLVFGTAHSYFFVPSLTLHFVQTISGISPLGSIYISVSIYGTLTALIGILVLKSIHRRRRPGGKNNDARSILPPLVAFSLVSFAYSERSMLAGGTNLSQLLMLLVFCFLFDGWFKGRSHAAIMLLLAVGVTLGSADAILLLIPFFFVFSMSSRTRTAVLYALIPLAYMTYAGYSYTISLKRYATFAWQGFWEFLEKAITGKLPERIVPWQRTISLTREDAVVASVTYVSLMLVSLMVALMSTFLLVKERRKRERDVPNILFWSNLACIWLALVNAMIAYVGVSTEPQAVFSDIRTIAIVLVSLLIPFQFMSERFIARISAKKTLLAFVMTLTIFASLRTVYELYPKSIDDPINVVEDYRCGSTAIYVAGNYINRYYKTGGIIGDYAVLNPIGELLPSSQYELRWLNETTLAYPFDRFPEKSILVFNKEAVEYPSIYHPPEAYMAAYDFAAVHSRIYDNGVIPIICHGKGG